MPAAPKAAKKPTDRQAKAEARSQFIEFVYEGVKYRIDRDNADDLEALEFVEDGKYLIALRSYLGRDQWAKWKDANRDAQGRVPSDAFEPFLDKVMAAIGGGTEEAPNFSGSAGS
jgi:hypothetical protein